MKCLKNPTLITNTPFPNKGLAKALVHKIKTMDPGTWKTADLEKILSGDMAIRQREDQPIRVSIKLMYKGTIVFYRQYDETDAGPEGKLGAFFVSIQSMGEFREVIFENADPKS